MNLPINYDNTHWSIRKQAREEYKKLQKNLCWHCGKSLHEKPNQKVLSKKINKSLFPEGFFKWPVHLHHDRNTGMTIGTVHSRCNAVLWQYYGE